MRSPITGIDPTAAYHPVIPDVMDIVAVEIHVPPARHVLDADAFHLADGGKTRGRCGLMQETPAVLGEKTAQFFVLGLRLPKRAEAATGCCRIRNALISSYGLLDQGAGAHICGGPLMIIHTSPLSGVGIPSSVSYGLPRRPLVIFLAAAGGEGE